MTNQKVKSPSSSTSAPKKKRASRPKVKTGCGTCKIRHIRCDEVKPVCTNCSSTRRVCDGYRVQFGTGDEWAVIGGNSLSTASPHAFSSSSSLSSRTSSASRSVSPFGASPRSLIFESDDDYKGFCNFRSDTATQLFSASHDQIWIDTILQMCHQSDAIRHAVVAVGGLSKRFQAGNSSVISLKTSESAQLDVLALSNYQKSLESLGQTLATKSTTPEYDTLRQTLITCMLFVFIDFLRGNDQSLLVHLSSGARLLQQHPELAIGEAKFHLRFLQMDMLITNWLDLPSVMSGPGLDFEMLQRAGLKHFEGRDPLDMLEGRLVVINNRMNTVRKAGVTHESSDWRTESQIQDLQSQFEAWSTSLEDFVTTSPGRGSETSQLRIKLLRMNFEHSQLMLKRCFMDATDVLYQVDEIETFETILTAATSLLQPVNLVRGLPNCFNNNGYYGWDGGKFEVQVIPLFRFPLGAIYPLYSIALSASLPDMCTRALDLLERDPWRECGWDSSAMASIARRRRRCRV